MTRTSTMENSIRTPRAGVSVDRPVKQQLGQLDQALTAGELTHARKIHARLRKSSLPVSVRGEFRALSQRLSELQDWQTFATAPKREELCQKMEALKDVADLHPSQRAREIRQLQREWKELGPSDTREGQQLWSRFRSAGDEAYVACRTYFEQQDELRRRTQLRRVQICQRLESFIETVDWETADFKRVVSLIRSSQHDWHGHDHVQSTRQLSRRFSAALKPIQQQLARQQASNHAQKRQLIDRLKEAMASAENFDNLLQQTKRTQRDWKAVGVTQRTTDQKLWKVFRGLCDEVFARQNGEQEERKSLHEDPATQDQPDRILAEIQRKAEICVQLEEGSLDSSAAEMAWVEATDDTPALPMDIEGKLLSRRNTHNGEPTPETVASAEYICVQAELLAGIETPDDDGLRTQLQVDRLRRGLTTRVKDERSAAEQLRDLQIAFHCLALGRAGGHLRGRFRSAEAACARTGER